MTTSDSQGAGIPALSPDNSNCKFAAGGAKCSWHCGDAICLGAPSPQTPAAAGDGLAVLGYVPEHQIRPGFKFACMADRIIVTDDIGLVRLSDAVAFITRLERELTNCKGAIANLMADAMEADHLKAARPDTAAIMALADTYAAAHMRMLLADLQNRPTIINAEDAREALRRALDGEG